MGVLTAVLGCGVLVGIGLLVWDWLGLGTVATLRQYEIYLQFKPGFLKHISRLWMRVDFCYLRQLDAKYLESRLRRDRRRIRRLALTDIRRQFRATVAVAKMFGTLPTARELNFGVDVLFWSARFHLAFVRLFLSSWSPLDRLPSVSPAGLLGILETAHRGTRALMVALTANDMDCLEDLILTE